MIKSYNNELIEDLIEDPLYEILPEGEIRTKVTKTGKISINNEWRFLTKIPKYGAVRISYKNKKILLHRIIFRKFKGLLIDGMVINHIDGNCFNNHVDNLEQITQSENNKHIFKFNKTWSNFKLTLEQAEEIRKLKKEGKTYSELIKIYNVSKALLIDIVRNRRYTQNANVTKKINYKSNCQKKDAQPVWVDRKALSDFYDACPEGMTVDHIHPLVHKDVCGLHVPWNLQYLTRKENRLKSNNFDFTYKNESWKSKK